MAITRTRAHLPYLTKTNVKMFQQNLISRFGEKVGGVFHVVIWSVG